MTWDVRTAYNGNHTLEAIARDAADNRATSSALVTVWAVRRRVRPSSPASRCPSCVTGWGDFPADYVWAGTPSSTVVNTGYLAYDRDPLSAHDLDWFRTYHPDWLVYKCDRVTPIQYFTDPLFVFDITNPAVREYQYGVFVRNYMKTGVDGIAIDNFSFHNYNGKCGVYDANGVWRQKYTGELDDPQYVADAVAWVAWMADRVRAAGGLVAINLVEPLHPDLDRVTSKVDLVYFEGGGFINTTCRRAGPTSGGSRNSRSIRRLVLERAVVVQDEACDYMSDMTPELASWGVANFFLLRGDRSYFSITQSYAWRPHIEPDYDGPEFHVPLGEPLERAAAAGCRLDAAVPERSRDRQPELGEPWDVDARCRGVPRRSTGGSSSGT